MPNIAPPALEYLVQTCGAPHRELARNTGLPMVAEQRDGFTHVLFTGRAARIP